MKNSIITSQNLISNLKAQGHRMTKSRKAMLGIFAFHSRPLTAVEIKKEMQKSGVTVDRTTIYREIGFLKSQQIIREIQLGERKKRFEFAHAHHHHVVCIHCGRIEDVTLKQNHGKDINTASRQTGFEIFQHSVEFFGVCGSCQRLPYRARKKESAS